ncbi:hypothetical protein ACHAPJ_003824 [Fusarium lateritium]
MDPLSGGPFKLIVDGQLVAWPKENGESLVQAESGHNPAVFSLQGDRLVAGEWALGRTMVEDLSFQPKRVVWCKREEARILRPVHMEMNENGPAIKFGDPFPEGEGYRDSPLKFIDDHLVVLLQEGVPSDVRVLPPF